MADDARRLYYAMRCCPLWHLRAALYAHVLKLPIIWNETICARYSSASCRLQFGCKLDIAKLDCISFYEITSKNQNELCNPWGAALRGAALPARYAARRYAAYLPSARPRHRTHYPPALRATRPRYAPHIRGDPTLLRFGSAHGVQSTGQSPKVRFISLT